MSIWNGFFKFIRVHDKIRNQLENKGDKLEAQELNLQLIKILNEWDPFGLGAGEYDPEIADVLYAVHETEDEHKLAIRIQAIYEHSFEELLPYEGCLLLAKTLLGLKEQGSCQL